MHQLAEVESMEFPQGLAVDVSDAASNSSGDHHTATAAPARPPLGDNPNVFIANLPAAWTEWLLREHLAPFGALASLRVNDERRFAFAHFETVSAASACIATLHGTHVPGAPGAALHVAHAMHSETGADEPNPRLFVRGLPPGASEKALRRIASPFGELTEASVVVHPDGTCKGSGFITFDKVDDASRFLEAANAAALPLPLESGDAPAVRLAVKYSETVEAKEARQRRNRERIAERASLGQPTPPSSLRSAPTPQLGQPVSLRSARSGRSGRQRQPNTSPHNNEGGDVSPHPRTPALAFGAAMTAAHAPRTATSSVALRPEGKSNTFGTANHPLTPGGGPRNTAPPMPLLLKCATPAFPVAGDLFLGPVGAIASAAAASELVANLAEMPVMVAPFRARNGETGFAIRLRTPAHADSVTEALNGASYVGGAPALTCWRFA